MKSIILTIYLALRTNLFPLGRLPCRDHLITSRSSWIKLPLRLFFPLLFSSWDTVCLCPPRIPAEIMVGLFYKDSEITKGKVTVAQSCPTLCDPLDYTVHGILQARILEWIAVPFSRDLPNPETEPESPALQVNSLPAEPQGECSERKTYCL